MTGLLQILESPQLETPDRPCHFAHFRISSFRMVCKQDGAARGSKTTKEAGERLKWWALSDSNGRPFGCKPNALTAELSAQQNSSYKKPGETVNARALCCFSRPYRSLGFGPFLHRLSRANLDFLHFPHTASTLICLHLRRGTNKDAARTGFCGPHGQ